VPISISTPSVFSRNTPAAAPAPWWCSELHLTSSDVTGVLLWNLMPRAQPQGGALGVFGKPVALSERQVVVELVTKVFDQGILQLVEKIIRGGSPSSRSGTTAFSIGEHAMSA
jgi:hypothetical protein